MKWDLERRPTCLPNHVSLSAIAVLSKQNKKCQIRCTGESEKVDWNIVGLAGQIMPKIMARDVDVNVVCCSISPSRYLQCYTLEGNGQSLCAHAHLRVRILHPVWDQWCCCKIKWLQAPNAASVARRDARATFPPWEKNWLFLYWNFAEGEWRSVWVYFYIKVDKMCRFNRDR